MCIVDQICLKILPRISNKITKLTVDPCSAKRILNTFDYPQLYSLSLVYYQTDTISRQLLNGPISHLLMNKITHLTINLYLQKEIPTEDEPMIFEAIIFFGKHLTDLIFAQQFSENYLSFLSWSNRDETCLSSTLTNLTIKVNSFDDCLYLLNGRFPSLSKLIIRIKEINRSLSNINNTKKLVKLKSFSLISERHTHYYDKLIVPLLGRMLNLEELSLQISIVRIQSTYIDGNQLYDDILKYMTQLKKFIFNIHTHVLNNNLENHILSNNDIRNSFMKRGYNSIDVCANEKLIDYRGNCHVYSLPYLFDEFLFMSSCFQGGKFYKVQTLSMFDRFSFENKLFKIISQDFPVLKRLIIYNLEEQENQEYSSTLIIFNYLCTLNIINAHQDYAIQFLTERNTYLPSLENLIIEYETLTNVTDYFTKDATRLNCAKIKYLTTDISFVRPANFDSYFPSM